MLIGWIWLKHTPPVTVKLDRKTLHRIFDTFGSTEHTKNVLIYREASRKIQRQTSILSSCRRLRVLAVQNRSRRCIIWSQVHLGAVCFTIQMSHMDEDESFVHLDFKVQVIWMTHLNEFYKFKLNFQNQPVEPKQTISTEMVSVQIYNVNYSHDIIYKLQT